MAKGIPADINTVQSITLSGATILNEGNPDLFITSGLFDPTINDINSRLSILGSGQGSGNGGTTPAPQINPPQRVGGVVVFDTSSDYNALQPYSGVITYDLTGAVPGVSAFMYYNGTELTLPNGSYLIGGTFVPGSTNLVKLMYYASDNVKVEIVSQSSGGYVNPVKKLFVQKKDNATTTAVNLTFINDNTASTPNIPLPANSYYEFEAVLTITSTGTSGVQFNVTWPLGVVSADSFIVFEGVAASASTYQRVLLSTGTPAMSGTTSFMKFASQASVRLFGRVRTTNAGNLNLGLISALSGQTVTATGSLNVTKVVE